jgi:hypothetical protein
MADAAIDAAIALEKPLLPRPSPNTNSPADDDIDTDVAS